MKVVKDSHGRPILIEELNKTYDLWVHTGRDVDIKKTYPDGPVARQKLKNPEVYEISRHVRGKAILISNTGYQAVRLLKSVYEQLQFRIIVHVNKTSEEILEILQNECRKIETKSANALVCILYGAPDNFDVCELPKVFSTDNCPHLAGKPKLLYVIGNDTLVKQVEYIQARKLGSDYFVGATDELVGTLIDSNRLTKGFFGIMFFIYVQHLFAHELDVASMWELEEQFSVLHNYSVRSYSTLTKEFYFFPGLTTSDMPHEIEQMDPYEMELYLKMVEKSKMKTYNIRLMFVGLFGAGKTSLARRMMNCGIDGVTSTDGIDVHIGRCRINLRDGRWATTGDVSHKPYAKLSRLLNENPEEEAKLPNLQDLASDQSFKKRKFMEDLVPSTETVPYIGQQETVAVNTAYASKDNLSVKKQKNEERMGELRSPSDDMSFHAKQNSSNEEPMETESTYSNSRNVNQFTSMPSMSTAVKVLKESKTSKGKTDLEALVSLWDFAGQFIYYATHQLFFSPRAIYLLVLNMTQDMSKNIDEKWFLDLDGVKDMEFQGAVQFWLKSIYIYSKSAIPGVPPVILVGTHKDIMERTSSDTRKRADEYFGKIFSAFIGKKIGQHLKGETFFIDNTIQDPEIERLREYILKIARSLPYWGEPIPARWVEMEQVLEEIRAEGKPFITRAELEHIDSKLSIPIGDKEQLTLFLKYENAAGTLIYFDEDYLRDTIVIEPSWIIHAFRFLISATCFDDKYGPLKEDWHNFIKKGQLKMELAEKIWKLDDEHGFFENNIILLQFLDKLDIMSRAKIVSEDGQTVELLDFYYVPCILNEPPTETLLVPPIGRDIASSSTLCFTFEDEFLPPAVFNRILSICLGMWPAARQGSRQLLFCGCGVFEVTPDKHSDIHRFTIFFKNSKIGLRVTRYATEEDASVDSQLCDRIRRLVARALEKELNRYHLVNENPGHKIKPYVYTIQCPETQRNQQLMDGLIKMGVLMQNYKTRKRYFCTEHSEKEHPHPLDPAELLKDWFPDEVVTNKGFISRYPAKRLNDFVTNKELSQLCQAVGAGWQFLGINLGLTQAQIDRCEESRPNRPIMQIYEMFLAWKQKETSDATLGNLMKALEECKTRVTLDQEVIKNVLDRML